MKNAVFRDVKPCSSRVNRRFGRVLQLLVTANVVPSSLISFILMMEAIRSSVGSRKSTWHHIPEDGILHNTRVCYICW
jgi:hypothetical protein